jgi:hypothetical protein
MKNISQTTSIIGFILSFCVLLGSVSCKKKHDSKRAIRNHVYELTNIELDTMKFSVVKDSINNTEGAFDLDYSWHVKIKIDNLYLNNLKKEIVSSKNFNLISFEYDDKWSSIDTAEIKGVWYRDSIYFKFVQKPRKFKHEDTHIKIDSLTGILDFQLIHI